MEREGGETEEKAKPLPTWRPGNPVNAAAAVRAFVKCRGDLLKAVLVADPLQLANELYSEDVVSKEVCDQILFLNITPTEKSMRLLTAVETRLSGHPSDFTTLITVLEADPTLKAVVNRLKGCYVDSCTSLVQVTLPHVSTDPLDDFVASLKEVYENTPVLLSNEEYPTPSTTYINLAVVKKEHTNRAEADKFTRATLHGGIDEIMHVKEPISIENVLKVEAGERDLRCILVEGAPGIGKSTFALQICRHWGSIEAIRRFAVVVLLRLREKRVQNAPSVSDLFYHDLPHIQHHVVERITSVRGDKVLLVLDGFDEFPVHLRKSSVIAQVIRGTCPSVAKATILITSRPSARADLLFLRPQPDKHIELLGFTSELIDQYASSSLGPDPAPLLADFRTYLNANPVIKSMMYVPLHSAIVVEIYRENRVAGRPIPQTMTQLYTELTLTRLRSYLRAEGYLQEDLPTDLEELPQGIHDHLFRLAKLGFEGTLKEKVIFNKIPDGCSSLGLMVVSQELYVGRRGSLSYNFFHLTLQEFLSAFYVSKLPGAEQKELFERCVFHQSHMKFVRKFVAGLTGFREIGWCSTSDGDMLTVDQSMLHELFEAQEKVNYELVFRDSTVEFIAGNRGSSLTAFDCFALGHCIAASRSAWKITFRSLGSCSWSEIVKMLACGLNSCTTVKGCIERLDLYSCLKGQNDLLGLNELPVTVLQHVSSLGVSMCELDRAGLDVLADVMVTMTSLRKLDIVDNPGGGGALVGLLNSSNYLHELHMSLIPLGYSDIITLAHVVRPSGNLKVLSIGDHSFSRETVSLMLRTVLFPSSLEKLSIYDTDLTLASFTELEGNCNLTGLFFYHCTMLNKGICSIASHLHINTTLKMLKLANVICRASDLRNVDDAVVALADVIKVNHTLNQVCYRLETPSVDRSAVKVEAMQAVIDALRYNDTVKKVTIGLGDYCHLSGEYKAEVQQDGRLKLI